jgi:hypothetical protein
MEYPLPLVNNMGPLCNDGVRKRVGIGYFMCAVLQTDDQRR